MGDELTKGNARVELGYTGLNQYGGYIDEEFVPDLKGDRRHKIYAEMSKNDSVVGAILFAVDKLTRNVQWTVEPGTVEGGEAADFLTGCMDGMEHTWSEFISQIMAMLVHGYSLFEVVYKIREDGNFIWRKFGFRSAETIPRWEFNDETGDLLAAIQMGPPTFKEVRLPMGKCLNFRTTAAKGNPEGASAIRNAYRPWYFKKRLEEIEAIGVERDLAGLPIIYAPEQIFRNDATDKEKAMLAELHMIAKRLRNDRQGSVVLPDIRDEKGNRRMTLELLSTGGRRQVNMTEIIGRYNQAIAITMLADFILIGHQQVGSFALADSKTAVFATALGAWLDVIEQTLNRIEVPRLFALNGMADKDLPQFRHSDIEKQDLTAIADYVVKLAGAGILQPDPDLERHLRRIGDLPEINEEARQQQPQQPMPEPPDGQETEADEEAQVLEPQQPQAASNQEQ